MEPSLEKENIEKEKIEILREIHSYLIRGYNTWGRVSIESDINDLKFQLSLLKHKKAKDKEAAAYNSFKKIILLILLEAITSDYFIEKIEKIEKVRRDKYLLSKYIIEEDYERLIAYFKND